MLRVTLKLLLSVLVLMVIDLAFQAGIWESLAKPASHAGTSVRLKHWLQDPHVAKIDFVTMGSSRPEFGINHVELAALGKAHDSVHANLTMPGSHWMTIGILSEWLARHHPEIRGGVIALSIQTFTNPGNGSYELGIVYPFHRMRDLPWMAEHIPLKRNDPESWGVWSGLFAWREDVRDFVLSPRKRLSSLRWFKRHKTWRELFHNPKSRGDMCAFGLDTMQACDQIEASDSKRAKGLVGQCRQLRGYAKHRADFNALRRAPQLPQNMAALRRLIRAQLRAMHWPVPPVVVLMPTPTIWTEHALPKGLHAWALSVLQPLVQDGTIQLIDGTDFFNRDGHTDCSQFFDFYHQNASGRDAFTRWLLPQLKRDLYAQHSAP